jgi:hypothetical protein
VIVHARRIATTLAAVVLGLTAVPAAVPAGAAATFTTQVGIRPVDADGHLRPGYHVTRHHGRASCLLGGIAVGTAYRCFAGNDHIYDPCWLQAGGTDHVLCLVTPWRQGVVRLHVTRGFDGSPRAALPRHPWGMQLADGTRCVGSQGAAGAVGGRGISYLCLDGETVLLGDPDISDPLWRIRAARDEAGGFHYEAIGFQAVDRTYVGKRSLRP